MEKISNHGIIIFSKVLLSTMLLVSFLSSCATQSTTGKPPAQELEMQENDSGEFYVDIEKTVVKMPISKDVSIDEAVESMKLRANELNIKLVAELPLSKQIKAMGESSRRMAIYQFCDALIAKKMVEYDIHFAAYLPCRISLVEDSHGKGWLLMMNMDMLINNPKLDENLRAVALTVRDSLLEIMTAGVNGDL